DLTDIIEFLLEQNSPVFPDAIEPLLQNPGLKLSPASQQKAVQLQEQTGERPKKYIAEITLSAAKEEELARPTASNEQSLAQSAVALWATEDGNRTLATTEARPHKAYQP
ncbi:MAG: hypothetical protein K0U12_04385, partial [Gammaproteobacteria bacterium]|nr:hypothetical protein [Gammaproteobacteria bacterium]